MDGIYLFFHSKIKHKYLEFYLFNHLDRYRELLSEILLIGIMIMNFLNILRMSLQFQKLRSEMMTNALELKLSELLLVLFRL